MVAGFADDNDRGVKGPVRISCIDVNCGIDDTARSRWHRALLPPGTSLQDQQVVTACLQSL